MSEGSNFFLCNKNFTADGTLFTFRQTCFGAGGSNGRKDFFCMSEGSNFFLCNKNFTADGAFFTFCQTCFGAGGSNGRNAFFRVLEGRGQRLFAAVAKTVLVGVGMCNGRHMVCHKVVATGTQINGVTAVFAGGCNDRGAVCMVGCFVNNFGVAVAAGAGVGANSRLQVGSRGGDRSGVGVCRNRGFFLCNEDFSANGALLAFRQAGLRAGCSNGRNAFFGVTEGGNVFSICVTFIVLTGIGHNPRFGTGRGSCDNSDIVMTDGRHIIGNIGIAADADIHGKPSVKAGRRCDKRSIAVGGRNGLRCRQHRIAQSTAAPLCEAAFCAGSRYGRNDFCCFMRTGKDNEIAVVHTGIGFGGGIVITDDGGSVGNCIGTAVNITIRIENGDRSKRFAAAERIIPDALHAVRDGDRGKRGAFPERTILDARHAVRDGDRGKRGAVFERIIPDARHAVRDGDRGKRDAAGERIIPDARHAVRDGDRGQLCAVVERIIPDVGDAVGDADFLDKAAVFVPRNGACGAVVIKGTAACDLQHAAAGERKVRIVSAIAGKENVTVRTVKGNKSTIVFFRIALGGRIVMTADNGGGGNGGTAVINLTILVFYDDFTGGRAAGECILPDTRHTVRDGDRGQRGAVFERTIPDARHAVWDGDRGQRGAFPERPIPDARHAVRNGDRGKRFAAVERIIPDARHAVTDGDRGQRFAECERTIPDARHAVRDGDRGQRFAPVERIVFHFRYRIRNDKVCHKRAVQVEIACIIQRIGRIAKINIAPFCQVRNVNSGQRGAVPERITPDARHAVRDGDRGQRGAVFERIIPDARHAVFKNHLFDGGVLIPRRISQSIIRHFTRTGNGESTLIVQCPNEILSTSTACCRVGGGGEQAAEVP